MQVDAIVNTTNEEMVGYSGVDLAIHTLAGKKLCKTKCSAPLAKRSFATKKMPCAWLELVVL